MGPTAGTRDNNTYVYSERLKHKPNPGVNDADACLIILFTCVLILPHFEAENWNSIHLL